MDITVLLGGALRHEALEGSQRRRVTLPKNSRIEDLLVRLDLDSERVKLILINGRGATMTTVLKEGDRVALFPPELSFNTFVSLSFRKERVEAREKE